MVLYGLVVAVACFVISTLAQDNGTSMFQNITYDDTSAFVLFGASDVCDSQSCMTGSSPPWLDTWYQDPYTKEYITFHTTSQRRARDSGGVPYMSLPFRGSAIYLYSITSRSSQCVYNVTVDGGETWETVRNNFTTANLTQNRLAWYKTGLDESRQYQFVLRFWADADGPWSLDGVDREGGSLNFDRLMITEPVRSDTASGLSAVNPMTMTGGNPSKTTLPLGDSSQVDAESSARNRSKDDITPLIVGLSVGLPLLLLLLLLLAFLWNGKRQQRAKENGKRESGIGVLGARHRTSTDDLDGGGGLTNDDASASQVEPFTVGLSQEGGQLHPGIAKSESSRGCDEGNMSMTSSPTSEKHFRYMEQVHPTSVSVSNGTPSGTWSKRAQVSPIFTATPNFQSLIPPESPTSSSSHNQSPGRRKSPAWANRVVDPKLAGVDVGYSPGVGLGLGLMNNGDDDADTRQAVENEGQLESERKLMRERGGSLSLANPNLAPSIIDEPETAERERTTDYDSGRDSPEQFSRPEGSRTRSSPKVRKSASLPEVMGPLSGSVMIKSLPRRGTAANAPKASAPPPYTSGVY